MPLFRQLSCFRNSPPPNAIPVELEPEASPRLKRQPHSFQGSPKKSIGFIRRQGSSDSRASTCSNDSISKLPPCRRASDPKIEAMMMPVPPEPRPSRCLRLSQPKTYSAIVDSMRHERGSRDWRNFDVFHNDEVDDRVSAVEVARKRAADYERKLRQFNSFSTDHSIGVDMIGWARTMVIVENTALLKGWLGRKRLELQAPISSDRIPHPTTHYRHSKQLTSPILINRIGFRHPSPEISPHLHYTAANQVVWSTPANTAITEIVSATPASPLLVSPSLNAEIPAITLTAAGVADSLHRGLANLKNKHVLVSVVVLPNLKRKWSNDQSKLAVPHPETKSEAKKQSYHGLLMQTRHGRSDYGNRARVIRREIRPLIPKKYLRDSAWRDMPVLEDDSENEELDID